MKDYLVLGYIARLNLILDRNEKLKLIYEWVKTDTINLTQFKTLIDHI